VVYVRDHNSFTEATNIIKPGDLFGEIALLCGCKRTASVKTSTYSTLARIDRANFKDMCQQYVGLTDKLKAKLKTYNDKLKIFLKLILRSVPFMKKLCNDSVEEVTYHLKQRYFDPDEVIFRAGDQVEYIYLITRGEVDLIVNVDKHDFVVHNLYQGCYMGGYKVLGDHSHSHTARAVSSVTLHCINKDSLSLLQNNLNDFKKEVELAMNYIDTTNDPVIGFGMFKDERGGNVTPTEVFRMSVVKILKLNRDFKEAGIENGVSRMLEKMQLNYFDEEEDIRKPKNYQRASFKIMQKLEKKIEKLDTQMQRMEKKFEKTEKVNRKQSMMMLKRIGSEIKSNHLSINPVDAKNDAGVEK